MFRFLYFKWKSKRPQQLRRKGADKQSGKGKKTKKIFNKPRALERRVQKKRKRRRLNEAKEPKVKWNCEFLVIFSLRGASTEFGAAVGYNIIWVFIFVCISSLALVWLPSSPDMLVTPFCFIFTHHLASKMLLLFTFLYFLLFVVLYEISFHLCNEVGENRKARLRILRCLTPMFSTVITEVWCVH